MPALSSHISRFFFKKITLPKWQFDLFLFMAVAIGSAFTFIFAANKIASVLAANDITSAWSFGTPADYTLSNSALAEIASSTARLKVQNYSSDANTSLLMHLDESSGEATDSSQNANVATASSLTFVPGNFNNAATFSGTLSKITLPDSSSLSLTQANTLEGWVKFNSDFSAGSQQSRQGIFDKGDYQLYFDNETGKLTYELADSTTTTWTQSAGSSLNNSWSIDGSVNIESVRTIGTDLYVGLGYGVGDADVWKWDGSSWTKIGGDGINSSWAINTFESVYSMATDGTNLYVGLGLTAGDAEVWKWNGSTWTKVGGDAANNSWALNTFEGVYSMYYQNNTLYAGLGNSANDAEVWACTSCDTSPSWTKIGGDSINQGWTTNFDTAYSLTGDGTNLYVGLGATAGEAEIWMWNGTVWAKVGGDTTGSSWDSTSYEYVLSMTYVGGNLYAGLGLSANDAEVWKCTNCDTSPSWSHIGGDSLNNGWTTNFEGVYSLTNDGTNIYAGLGNTAGDNEVWQWNGSTWAKIGGDAVDSSFTNTHTIVNSLYYANSTLYAGLNTTSGAYTGQIWSYKTSDSPKWTLLGGNYVKSSWGFRGLNDVEVLNVSGDYLYAGTGYAYAEDALVWRFDGTSWSMIGGQGINSSWSINTFESVSSMVSYKGNLYVGLGTGANDAEVWKWDGSTWSQIGGDSLKSGWGTNFEQVNILAQMDGYLYAGIGNSANDAEVWRYSDVSDTWFRVGGDNIFSGWATNMEQVLSLQPYHGKLYAGIGNTDQDAEVWECSNCNTATPSWLKVGGDGANNSWNTSPVDYYNNVDNLMVWNDKLIAGLGTETGEASVWSYDGSSWTKIGGDDLNNSWASATYERIRTTVAYNGDLYAGLGNSTGDGEVWKFDGSTWSQVGGDSLNSGWANAVEELNSFSVYKGKLYAGTGNTANADAAVWSYGNNSVLQSNTSSFDTNWHHVAATYDGSTMKIYLDGTLDNSQSSSVSMPNTNRNLLIGTTYAGREFGKPDGHLNGKLDELRISSIARSSFTTTPYSSSLQTVQPTAAVFTQGIKNFDSFTASESGVGTITYRISSDNGSSWKYYSGGWTTSASTSQTNSAATINSNISTFTVGSGGILWQAVLSGNGNQQTALNYVEIGATRDSTAPSNPNSLTALSASGGSSITTNTWYNHTGPTFSWTGASDGSGAGIAGYYVYFGTDDTADPQTAGSFQAASTYTASLLTSGSTYYLLIKSKDNAQNSASTIWSPFSYKFDNTSPTNPTSITVSPAGYTSTNSYTFSWPSSGSGSATDSGSLVSGFQYKTGTASGALSDWSATTSATSIAISNAAYQTDANVFYLRTIDNAGNTQTTASQINYYYAGSGPSAPQFLSVNPDTNTTNSFAFSWQAPSTYSGNASDLTYCYTVNTLPSASTCTYTSAGATSLAAGSFATQVGLNTFYLVAKNGSDAGGAISYSNYTSVTFTANTSAPGIPLNLDISDVSIKSTSSWRLAVSWTAPTSSGSGVSNYKILRSEDDSTFTEIASTTGLAYIDTGLDQEIYYYKIKACDNVNNCGEQTASVNLEPTGKYTEAAGLSTDPKVSSITTKKALISWATDRESDSKIQYGTSPGSYFSEEPSNSTQVTAHEISLSNLSAGTTYYYKAKWTDEDGNTGTASERSFTTDPAPTITDATATNIGLDRALIKFIVNGASSVNLHFGKTTAFGGLETVNTSTSETNQTIELEDLEDDTKYYYKINALDSEENEYEGTILSFSTLPRPKISTVRIQQVNGTAQPTVLVSWITNTETSSIVTYFPSSNPGASNDEVNPALTKGEHKLIIRNLTAQTPYTLVVSGRDKAGNEASSEKQTFTTATDTRPPQIQNVKVEGSSQTSQDQTNQTSQIVVSWDTDEAATSQVEYGEGTSDNYAQKTQADSRLATNHLVVISGLSPSKVYHLRALSLDKAGNTSKSVDTVTITPKAIDNALDLVIQNLRQAFGFIK